MRASPKLVRADFRPVRAYFRPRRDSFKLWRAYCRLMRLEFRPQWAEFWDPGGSNVHTDGHIVIHPYKLQDIGPLVENHPYNPQDIGPLAYVESSHLETTYQVSTKSVEKCQSYARFSLLGR